MYVKSWLATALLASASIMSLPVSATGHTTKSAPKKSHSYGAKQRMHNRLLLAKARTSHHTTPIVRGDAHSKAQLRAQNRNFLEQHPEWFVSPYRMTSHHLQDGTGLVNNDHVQSVTEKIMRNLQRQLGKPYVWGGESPEEGFDCSGLVYYAFNSQLAAKLPRTADEMFRYRRARHVADNDLRRGDLLFFQIHSHGKADHMGVYLGNGRFIQAPRTGERIQISYLDDEFWQQHYLGGRRVIMDNTVL